MNSRIGHLLPSTNKNTTRLLSAVENISESLKIYNFDVSFYFGVLPIWMIVPWPSFSILFDEVFVFLSNYKFIAVFLSGILGPLTYYSGAPLGLLKINQLYLFLFLMIIFWLSLMYFYLKYLIKFKFD